MLLAGLPNIPKLSHQVLKCSLIGIPRACLSSLTRQYGNFPSCSQQDSQYKPIWLLSDGLMSSHTVPLCTPIVISSATQESPENKFSGMGKAPICILSASYSAHIRVQSPSQIQMGTSHLYPTGFPNPSYSYQANPIRLARWDPLRVTWDLFGSFPFRE